jgi:chromosome segregation ATPase
MTNIAERYVRLSRAYIQLADTFHRLDVDYMGLKSKVAPLLNTVKTYQQTIEQLTQEKRELEEKLQEVTAKYENFKSFEALLQPDVQTALIEAEEQILLVEETMREIQENGDPDLNEADKQLLEDYCHNSAAFELSNFHFSASSNHHSINEENSTSRAT